MTLYSLVEICDAMIESLLLLQCEGEHFRYDNLNQSPSSITPTSGSRDGNHFRYESGGNTPVGNVTPTSRGPHTPPMGRTQSMQEHLLFTQNHRLDPDQFCRYYML